MRLIAGQCDRQCRGCGCSDDRACPGGCAWVLLDVDSPTGICSVCAEAWAWDQNLFLGCYDGDLGLNASVACAYPCLDKEENSHGL